ncbi:MAG: hypothetical protein JW986_09905 [Methanotrichaceae archaeon]|nr:hypothetical protein [Methanotrichaceae archaeon]
MKSCYTELRGEALTGSQGSVIEERLAALRKRPSGKIALLLGGKHSCEVEDLMIMKGSVDLLDTLAKRIQGDAQLWDPRDPDVSHARRRGRGYLLWPCGALERFEVM